MYLISGNSSLAPGLWSLEVLGHLKCTELSSQTPTWWGHSAELLARNAIWADVAHLAVFLKSLNSNRFFCERAGCNPWAARHARKRHTPLGRRVPNLSSQHVSSASLSWNQASKHMSDASKVDVNASGSRKPLKCTWLLPQIR